MAQKETSSKSRRWLGLSGAAVLVANLVLTGTTIAFQQEGEVNHALGIEGFDASYGGTEFSADGTLSDASYEKYIEAADHFHPPFYTWYRIGSNQQRLRIPYISGYPRLWKH